MSGFAALSRKGRGAVAVQNICESSPNPKGRLPTYFYFNDYGPGIVDEYERIFLLEIDMNRSCSICERTGPQTMYVNNDIGMQFCFHCAISICVIPYKGKRGEEVVDSER